MFFVFLFFPNQASAATVVYDTTSSLTIPGGQTHYSMNFNTTVPADATAASLEIKWLNVGDNDNRDWLACGGTVLYTTGNSPGTIMPPYPKTVTSNVLNCVRGQNLATGSRICTANAWNTNCGGFFYGTASLHSTIEYARLTVTFDDGAPVVSSFSPADNATASGVNDNLVINFDRATTVHSGNIVIKKTSDNSTVETIDATGGQVSGSGTSSITINPSITLDGDTGYYVQIDGTVFDDGLGNYYAGISNATTWNFTTIDLTPPTSQASNLNFSSVAYTSMGVSWTNGNGDGRIVFAKEASSGTAVPVNATNYTASATFGSGTQIDSSGWYAIYKGTGTSVTVTNLNPNTDYIFQVFEYDLSGSDPLFLFDTASNNPNVQVTPALVEPTTQASSVSFSSVSNASMTVSWANGNGNGRVVFVKQDDSGTTAPVDNTDYTASATFGSGTQIDSSGWYCVYKGTGTSVAVSGLSTETNYIAQVFEYNSAGANIDFLTDTAINNPKFQITAEAPSEVVIGSGVSTTGVADAAPINIWYQSLHGQSVYTATELNTAGIIGPAQITKIGFYIASAPVRALPNFVIRMKHTTDSNVANWQSATGMTTVYSSANYSPIAGDFELLTLTTPFDWNGTDNIVIDTAFSLVSYSQSGTVRYYNSTNGYRYARSDASDQTNIFSGGSASSAKPQIKLAFIESDTIAPTITSVSSNKSNGSYKTGEVIDVDVNFSESVTSIGDVTVTLNTGHTCTFAISNSASGTCDYIVQTGDTSADLDATISGAIVDQAGNSMSNFVPAASLASSKNLVIDTTAPETPVATPLAGTYTSIQSVSLASSGSSAIYYTTNGDAPTISSTLYVSAITVDDSKTIKALALDLAGNESEILTTSYEINLDSEAPIIDDVNADSDDDSAIISWITDEDSSSQVEYGLISSYGEETIEADTISTVSEHEVALNDLESCARYYYRVKSKDEDDNQGVSSQYSFSTSGCDISSILEGNASQIAVSGGSISLDTENGEAEMIFPNDFYSESIKIQINKLESDSLLASPSGSILAGDNLFRLLAVSERGEIVENFDSPVVFIIFYGSEIENLYDENTLGVYRYEAGNWVNKNCALDTVANTLTCSLSNFSTYGVFGEIIEDDLQDDDEKDVEVKNVKFVAGRNSITINWETNLKADSKVKYGTKKSSLNKNKKESKKEKKHQIVLRNLDSDTEYFFKIYSEKNDDNTDSSKIYSVKTKNNIDIEEKINLDYFGNAMPNTCSYVVKNGDSLWSIAKNIYGDAMAYPLIVKKNKEKYPNLTHSLNVGQELIFDCQKNEDQNHEQLPESQVSEKSQSSTFKWWNPFSWFFCQSC